MTASKDLPVSGFKIVPMKKVLIAVDYDPTAKKVAEKGFSLAKSLNAEVTLLHVIADNAYYSSLGTSPIMGFNGFNPNDFFQYVNDEGLTKASEYFLEKMKHHFDDETITTMVEQGDFAEVILKTAKNLHADVIVMGSHSRRWLEQILLGGITEKVLNNTSIPLFIVPIKVYTGK